MFGTAGTRPPHGHEKRFNSLWGYLGPGAFTLGSRTFRCDDRLQFTDGPNAGRPFRIECEDGRFWLLANHGGAVNEAFSDIIGTAVEFSVHPPGAGPLRADYVIGEDTGHSGRSLENPRANRVGDSTLSYPDAYSRLFYFLFGIFDDDESAFVLNIGSVDRRTIIALPTRDRAGVHVNSTLLSHAFYLAIEGGKNTTTGRTVVGVGDAYRGEVERAFFRAMTDLMPARTNFFMTAAAIRQSAIDLNGARSVTYRAIDDALRAVGLPETVQ